MKKLLKLSIIVLLIGILGGCNVDSKKETLTKEQQNNVATWILRTYKDIHQIKFIKFYRHQPTGFLNLFVEINGDPNKRTRLPLDSYEEYNKKNGYVWLDPEGRFKELERENKLPEDEEVSFDGVKIIYLGE